jgi:hypothetical protein
MNYKLLRTMVVTAVAIPVLYFGLHSCSCREAEGELEKKAKIGFTEKEQKVQAFDFVRNQMEKSPELTDYLGPNARHYMKKKAIAESTGKVLDNVYGGLKEGYNIIKGE